MYATVIFFIVRGGYFPVMTVFVTLPQSLSVMQSGSYNRDTKHSSVTDGRAQDRVKTQLNITAYKRKTKLSYATVPCSKNELGDGKSPFIIRIDLRKYDSH